MTDQIRVLCVDDHRMVLEGVAAILGRERDCAVVGLATNGSEAVSLFHRHRPDIVLMDLRLPRLSGVEAIRQIRSEVSDAKIVVLTIYDGEEDVFRALEAGAAAYLLKDTLSNDLVNVIRDVHVGRYRLPETINILIRQRNAHALSPREVQVVELIARGQRNKEVAHTLGLSEDTVRVYVKKLLAKLKVRDRAAAVRIAIRRGIVDVLDVQ